MSQALHTSSTGINAGQSQINVIANNVANINTTAFKSAKVTFETLYSNNLSYGKAATKDGGGTNPKQIGLGVKVGGITRNFTSGQFVQTGRDTDLMISGSGFFVVQDNDGKQYFTRDGVFSLDSNGNLVTNGGMKVVGAESMYSTSSSSTTVKVPKNLKVDIKGAEDLGTKTLKELNDALIRTGDVGLRIMEADGTFVKDVLLTIDSVDQSVQDMVDDFNTQIANDKVKAVVNTDGTIGFSVDPTLKIAFDEEKTTSNFLAQTSISDINLTSKILHQSVSLNDMLYYNDSEAVSLDNISVDENGIIVATYTDGSILTKYVDEAETTQWKFITAEGVTIEGNDDVKASGSIFADTNFVIELATMVNQEGLVSINQNLWEWGPDVGEIYYGMAGEMAFGQIEAGGYEGSNVDIAFELSNMITAQRMIQMNSRVFSTASSVMETLAYLGQ